MAQKQLNQLLSLQKLTASTIHSISKEIIDTIELALMGDDDSFERLKTINAKEYDILPTFFKISSLLMKVYPMEHRIIGTELIKNLDTLPEAKELDWSAISEADINILKYYINHYEKQ